MEDDSIFSTIIENIPIPILIIEILEYPNKISFKTVNRAFRELNLEYSLLPAADIQSSDVIIEKFSSEVSEKKFDILMGVVFDLVKEQIGNQRKIIINLDKRNLKIEELKSISSPESENRVPCGHTFFKINDNTVGIVFEILERSKKKHDIDFLNLNIISNVPTGAFILHDNKIIDTNLQFTNMLGFSDVEKLKGRNIKDFLYPEDFQNFFQNFETVAKVNNDLPTKETFRFQKLNGGTIWLNIKFGIYISLEDESRSIYINALDVTEKKEKEILLLQSHRLASVGNLTAGFAHEINNPLFGIINYSHLIKESIDEGISINKNSEEYEFLLGIIEESQRISKIIGNLSEFSKKGEEKDFSRVKIPDIIEKVVKLLSYKIKRNQINVENKIDESFPSLILQQYPLENCLFNLMLNSIDALENIKDRERIIKITPNIIESDDKRDLEIKFYDNGEGIPDEFLTNIFNPFFSTRREKKGTGLGLYTVHNIIEDMRGQITVTSKNEEWTEFRIVIPLKDPAEDKKHAELFLK